MSYHNTSSSSSDTGSSTSGGGGTSSGYDKLYFPTNSDTRRRMGRMEQAYSLSDPYGTLSIRPIVSNGAVSGFDPISVVYCPSTEKVYCGDNDHFIYALNPKKTGLETIPLGHRTSNQWGVLGNLGSYGDDHSSVSVTAEYDSEFIKENDSANGAMHKTRIITTSNFSGKAEVRFLIRMGEKTSGWAGASYYYGYKITKNNASGTLSLGNVVAEGCYNENINKSYSKSTTEGENEVNLTPPNTLGDLGSKWTPHLVTVEIDEGDSLELWVGGAMEDCASTGGSTSSVSQKISIKDYGAQALYGGSLEECVIWNGSNDFERKDYIGNFTSYENRYYVDGVYSPINHSIYYAFGLKDLYETLNGGYGVAKLNPYTNVIEEEISLYNFDPSTNQIHADSNLSQMKNVLPLPKKLIYCPTNNRVYILHGDPIKSWVTVLNPSSDKISGSFTHASFLDSSDIEYSAVNDKIYVTNKAGYAISVINPHINTTISSALPFLCDSWATLLLHLDLDFCDACAGSSGGNLVVSLKGAGAIIKDSEMSILFGKDIDYKTSFSFDPDEQKLDKEQLLPDDKYSKRWKEKDFNKTQCNRTHTVFDGETCQKIPYRPEWGAATDEFTIEFWVKPDENYFITPGNQNIDVNSNEFRRFYWERYDPKVNPEKIDKVISEYTIENEDEHPAFFQTPLEAEVNYAGSSMLLFSFGNPHQPTDLSNPLPVGLPAWMPIRGGKRHLGCAFSLVLRQGKTHDDPDRGTLRLWQGGDAGEAHQFLNIKPLDKAHRIKFGEWNHIALVKKPLHHVSGTPAATAPNLIKESKLIVYVNGVEWGKPGVGGYPGDLYFDLNPQLPPTQLHLDSTHPIDVDEWTELAEKARTLYLGGTAGNKLLQKILDIDFETDEVTTDAPHGMSTGDEINIYSSSGTYPLGVSEFTKYYIKKISDNKLTLYLTNDEAMNPAEIVPVNLENLSLLITPQEFKYSTRGSDCLQSGGSARYPGPDGIFGNEDDTYGARYILQCESSIGHQERLIMDTLGWPNLTEVSEEMFSHKVMRKGIVSINMKFKTCAADYYRYTEEWTSEEARAAYAEHYRVAGKTIDIYKNNKFYQSITLDSRFDPEKNLSTCTEIDAFDSPIVIECKEGDVITAIFLQHVSVWNIFETIVTESPSVFNDLFVSKPKVVTHDWMHYSGLMNCFRFSNIVRYDRNFRPLRFNDFKEDEHTLLLVNGDGKAKAKNNFLDLSGGNYTSHQAGDVVHPVYGSGAGILETSLPSPGDILAPRGVSDTGWAGAADWVEETRNEEPGASYTLPLGYEASSITSIKDVDGKFDFDEAQDFRIAVEALSLETPYYGGEDFEGTDKPMILAHYVSEDETIEYEFVVSKTNHPDLAPNGSGLYFRQWNKDVLMVNLFAEIHPNVFNSWRAYYISRTITQGENNLSTLSIGMLPRASANVSTPIELAQQAGEAVESHYPESFSKRGTFTIGGFNTSTRRPNNSKKRMAIGQYQVLGAGAKEILELDPHIGNYRNKLGAAYSGLDSSCFYEMKNVEIISLGRLAIKKRGEGDAQMFGLQGSLLSGCAGPNGVGSIYCLDLTGSAPLVDPDVGFNILNPQTNLVDKSLSVGKAGWKINSLSNVDQQGVAFFKGNTQIAQDDAHLWRQASDESYIKHLPNVGKTSGAYEVLAVGQSVPVNVHAPIYGFDPDLSSFGNKNFIIECSIMPMKLPVDDDDTDTAVDAKMGILCFNYDNLDNSDVDWADCPDYAIDGLGNTLSQCSNDVNGNIYWQSTGGNTGTVGWELRTNTSGTVEFNFGSQERNTIPGDLDYYYDGTSRNLTSTTALSYNNWYTITISRIGDNVHLYINGSLESSIDIGKETILEHPINLGVSKYEKMGLLIGKSYNGVTDDSSTPYYFTGLMEEVRIRPSKGNAHHTFRPNKSFELDRARKSFVDSSLVSHGEATTDQHAQLWIGSADYLHLNFNNFINNKAPWGTPEFDTTYSEDGNWLIGPGPLTKPNGITFDIEQEGIVKLRNNDEEGVLRLGQDGYLEIMGSSKLDLGENFVIEGWSLSSENQTLISRTDSSGSGWILELQQSGLSFVLQESGIRIKEIKGSYSSGPIGKWDHFAVQLENASTISLMLDGNCIASDELSAAQYAVMNMSSDQAIYIGSNSRSEILYLDNIRVIKEAIYKNYKKPTFPQGKIELIREPDTYHLNSRGVNYEKSHLSDHSLKFKSNYAKGDYGELSFGNVNAGDLADFNFGSEDFSVEFFFRADDLGDLKEETTVLVNKGLPGGLDSDFSIGLENRTIAGGIRRSRLVAEACGVRLVAKENRAQQSSTAPDTLWFYNVDDFHNNDFAGDNNDPDDYVIQKYKHVMLCRHTYAGVPYLSLFVDKRLVASSYEISSYDSVTDTFTYSSVQVGDSEDDTTHGVAIGGHGHSPGTYGYFSGNISLLKIERGTNPNLSVSYADEWLKDRLKAGVAARVYSIPGDSTSTILTNQYGGSSGKWATGMKLHDQNILFQQDFEGYSSHESENTLALGFFSSPEGAHALAYEDSGLVSYPDVDGWYLQPNILKDSRITTLPVPGGTELFLDFKESASLGDGVLCRDLGPKAKEYSLSQRGENIIDSLDKNTKGMYTPPTSVSSAYFGKISTTTTNSKHTAGVNDYILAYDNKNKWNYFDEDFTVAVWIKPENLANNPILFSRNTSGLLMNLAADNSGKLIFTVESERSSLVFESVPVLTGQYSSTVTENEWIHIALSRGAPPYTEGKKWFWFINGLMQPGVLTRGQVNDVIPEFTGHSSEILSVGRQAISVSAHSWDVDEATELYIHQGDAAEDDLDVYDFSSNAHAVTANGVGSGYPPIWAKPESGPIPGTGTEDLSIEFDGVDDDLEVSGNWIKNIVSNNIERETTWECWFNTSSTDLQYLVSLNTNQQYWGLAIRPSGEDGWTIQWNGNIEPASDDAVRANVTIDTGIWHHIAVVKDGERLEIYFDGARVAYTNSYVEPIDYGWDNITIGSQHYSGGAHRYFFTGFMDEIRFSNTKRYNVGFSPEASRRQFEGYMSEFLITTAFHEGAWGERDIYVHSGLDTRWPGAIKGEGGFSTNASHIYGQGAQTVYPSDIKFLLNFDDLEDHSMDIERGKPETSEETVLLLPFDRDVEDKSGQKKEETTSEVKCLQHLKYSTLGSSTWWINKASKGRRLVGDYEVHGNLDIEPDHSNNNAVNFPGDAGSYLSLQDREGTPQIIETDKTKFLGECCDSELEAYMESDWAWVRNCPNRYDYSLEFWVRPEDPTLEHYGAIAAASGENVKQLMIPLIGGEHVDSQGDTSMYFYVCLKIENEDIDFEGGDLGSEGGQNPHANITSFFYYNEPENCNSWTAEPDIHHPGSYDGCVGGPPCSRCNTSPTHNNHEDGHRTGGTFINLHTATLVEGAEFSTPVHYLAPQRGQTTTVGDPVLKHTVEKSGTVTMAFTMTHCEVRDYPDTGMGWGTTSIMVNGEFVEATPMVTSFTGCDTAHRRRSVDDEGHDDNRSGPFEVGPLSVVAGDVITAMSNTQGEYEVHVMYEWKVYEEEEVPTNTSGGGIQGGSIVVCARDAWDADPQNDDAKKFADGKIRTEALADNIILSEEHQGSSGSGQFVDIAGAHATDLKHVYVARKDGFWFLYVNGQYVDHMKEGEGRNNLYTKNFAEDISLNKWRVGGRTNIAVKDKPYVSMTDEIGRYQNEPWVVEGIFKGKIDMVREISGGIPYNPIEWKGPYELSSSSGAVKSFEFGGIVHHFAGPQLNDISVFSAFEKGQKGFPDTIGTDDSWYWDRKLNEFYCTTEGNCDGNPPPPPPPPPPCFVAGTKISMKDGSEKNIEDIIIGDKVKSLDVDMNEEASSLVVGVTKHDHTEGYYIINDDLKVTGEHPMRANDEWKNINELFVGDQLLRLDGSRVAVESIEKINDTVTTYNINVEDIDNYFANSYLSHNKDPVPMGACCDTLNQICGMTTQSICEGLGFYFYGNDTTCANEGVSCGGAGNGLFGACCYSWSRQVILNDGTVTDRFTTDYVCVETTEVNCWELGETSRSHWYGAGSICRTEYPGTVNYGTCGGGSVFEDPDKMAPICSCEDALTTDTRSPVVPPQPAAWAPDGLGSEIRGCFLPDGRVDPGCCCSNGLFMMSGTLMYMNPETEGVIVWAGSIYDQDPSKCICFQEGDIPEPTPPPNDGEGTSSPSSICTIQLFPFEPETVVDDCWTNEKRENANLYLDLIEKGTVRGFWKTAGDINCALVSSNTCPIIDLQDRAVSVGSGEWDGTCYSILEDSENWDFGKEDFTVEFWYKRAGSGVSSNSGPFDASGTCVVARQGYGFSMDSLGWGVELSYVKQDLATLFTYWRLKRREGHYIDSVSGRSCPRNAMCIADSPLPPALWPSYSNEYFFEKAWESSLEKLSSPEMRFSFCVDNVSIVPLAVPTPPTSVACFWYQHGGTYIDSYGDDVEPPGLNPAYYLYSKNYQGAVLVVCPNIPDDAPVSGLRKMITHEGSIKVKVTGYNSSVMAVHNECQIFLNGGLRYSYTYENSQPPYEPGGCLGWNALGRDDCVTNDCSGDDDPPWDSTGYGAATLVIPVKWGDDFECVNSGNSVYDFEVVLEICQNKPIPPPANKPAPAGAGGKILVPFTLSWGSPKPNQWEHYAIVRSEQTFRTFKNGRIIDELVGDQSVVRYNVDEGDKIVGGTDSDTKFNIKSPTNHPVLSIAGDTRFINKGWLLNGNLDELRISKGVARYTGEFEVGGQSALGAVESLIPTTQKTASITYCPTNKMLYAFTASSGQSYEINPRVNAITSTSTFSTSETERVDSSYFCPINNTILVSSYDGLHRLYSFLPMVGKICQVFTTPDEGRMTYAPNTNKMYYACKNYVYEIGDIPYDDWDGVQQ